MMVHMEINTNTNTAAETAELPRKITQWHDRAVELNADEVTLEWHGGDCVWLTAHFQTGGNGLNKTTVHVGWYFAKPHPDGIGRKRAGVRFIGGTASDLFSGGFGMKIKTYLDLRIGLEYSCDSDTREQVINERYGLQGV